MAGKKVKVLRTRRFNIVHLIFLIFFIYMIIMVGRYIAKEDIKVCEVTEGSLTQNHNYTGLILRTEDVLYSDTEGYVKCYVSDGDRISVDGIVYAVDPTGDVLKSSGSGAQSSITDEQYRTLRKYLNHFSTSYIGQDFTDVYTFKDQLTTTLYGIEQQAAGEQEEESGLSVKKASVSGVVYFTMDGYESLTADNVTRESLSNIILSGSRVMTGDQIAAKTPVCKIISDENWSIIIPITEEDARYYADKTKATILLTDISAEVTADIKVYDDSNGDKLAVVTLDDYMSSYSADRMVSFQLVKPVISGLKVPRTSVVSSELYTIPVEYGHKPKNSNSIQFSRIPAGKKEMEEITPEISYVDSQYYYIENTELQPGDVIQKLDEDGNVTGDGYEIGGKKTLKGVYNVNKGFAVFEVVEILDENDAYCIVKSGTTYGLAVYDHIVLNASTVDEDDLLY
ncbi:MAG: HlyD family efflux transporter periplasmic adaptor subunit [Lachnospiraceae bacterium]|nr:HlyD family efflux transporter periplasmic adaptor subunit [Lachnospiraceae bacterium]MDY4970293.1 HlyD family efflux transporter periplasmic adaptor subunit [Lachnospiraceae bacterium]